MDTTRGSRQRTRIALYVLSLMFAVVPAASHAATSVDAQQVLPPDQQSCPIVGATDVHPYVYDGALHSFDITVSDPSYVVLSGQVGDYAVGFELATRYSNPDGSLRIHVDIPTMRLVSDLPISLTLMANHPQGSGVTCVVTVSTVVPGLTAVPVPGQPGQNTSGSSQAPAQYPWGHVSYNDGSAKPAPSTGGQGNATTAPEAHVPAMITATDSLGNVCGAAGGPARLWTILLVLYAIFVWVLVTMQGKKEESSDWNVGLVVVAFLALLLFWYASAICRTGSWAPILATVIACAGLIGLTQSVQEDEQMLLLQDTKGA